MYIVQFSLSNPTDELFIHDYKDHTKSRPKHKEGVKRRQADQKDRENILIELQKHANPLIDNGPALHNIVNGQIVTGSVIIQNALEIGTDQSSSFDNSLPSAFHSAISRRILTLESMKKSITIKGKQVYVMESLGFCLLHSSELLSPETCLNRS